MMTTELAVKPFKDNHTKRMYDNWIKDSRVRSIAIERITPAATGLVKTTVARVLADLDVRIDTLVVGRTGRKAKCKIEARLLHEAGIGENFFCGLVQSALRNIRDTRAAETGLSPVNDEGHLTFTYKP